MVYVQSGLSEKIGCVIYCTLNKPQVRQWFVTVDEKIN